MTVGLPSRDRCNSKHGTLAHVSNTRTRRSQTLAYIVLTFELARTKSIYPVLFARVSLKVNTIYEGRVWERGYVRVRVYVYTKHGKLCARLREEKTGISTGRGTASNAA